MSADIVITPDSMQINLSDIKKDFVISICDKMGVKYTLNYDETCCRIETSPESLWQILNAITYGAVVPIEIW